MLFVPLPFVVALLLVILLIRMALHGDERPANRLFLALVGLSAVLSILIGLRWGYGLTAVLPLQSLLAAAWPSLIWLSFEEFAKGKAGRSAAPHLLPVILVALMIALWPDVIDLTIIATHLLYGIMLARLAWTGPDALRLVRLDEAPQIYRALQVASITLLASAALDTAISIDMRWWDGSHSAMVVGLANMPILLLLGFVAAIAGHHPSRETEEKEDVFRPAADGEDIAIVEQINQLMQTKGLFRDHDLNLDRLARKSGIPSRRISSAINRVEGKNVSQYVNDYRIAEACRLLASTDQPVTSVMFEAGFQTKSNFNREFRRVTGMSPSDWKATKADPIAVPTFQASAASS